MSLLDTPTQGKAEVLRGLRALVAREGRYVPPRRLRWVLGPRAAVDDIDTVLTALAGDPRLEDDGDGNYGLTAAGVLYARIHRPQRRFADT